MCSSFSGGILQLLKKSYKNVSDNFLCTLKFKYWILKLWVLVVQFFKYEIFRIYSGFEFFCFCFTDEITKLLSFYAASRKRKTIKLTWQNLETPCFLLYFIFHHVSESPSVCISLCFPSVHISLSWKSLLRLFIQVKSFLSRIFPLEFSCVLLYPFFPLSFFSWPLDGGLFMINKERQFAFSCWAKKSHLTSSFWQILGFYCFRGFLKCTIK